MAEASTLASTNTTAMRVLTLNIYGDNNAWPARRGVLRDGFAYLRPDLVALQETVVRQGFDQVEELLGANYHIVHSQERHSDGMGISIASRWPIRSTTDLDVHVTARSEGFPCTTLVAEVDAPEPFGPVYLVNHFPDYQPNLERERELQTVITAHYIEERIGTDDAHVILAGDLDAEPDAASLRFLAGRQSLEGMSVCYRNAWEWANPGRAAPTFTKRNALMAVANAGWPFQCIDHIFVRCGTQGWPTLHVESCTLAFGEAVRGVWASDHIGLVADLSVTVAGAG
jgi:endonuclease/exonuclease/phosphatase family metal-dependent hydrolase